MQLVDAADALITCGLRFIRIPAGVVCVCMCVCEAAAESAAKISLA